jgi:hypothetical protein
MAIAGNPKILVGWLTKQHQTGQMAGILNKDAVKEGRGIAYTNPKTGKLEVEDMSSYMTGAKKIRVGLAEVNGKKQAQLEGEIKGKEFKPYRVDRKFTDEGKLTIARAKELQQKAIALEEKASKAEAIAAKATHPEQKKRANLLMSQFKGQAKKLRDWITGQGKVEPVKVSQPVKQVEKLATAIAENASQLQTAIAQAEQPKPSIPSVELLTEMSSLIRKGYKVTGQDGDNITFKKGDKQVVVGPSKPSSPSQKEPAIAAKPVTAKSSQEPSSLSKEKPFKDGEIPDPVELGKQGYEVIGRGAYGRVYQKGDQAVKYGITLSESEYAIGKQAENLGIGPKVYGRNKVDGVIGMSMEFLPGDPLVKINPLADKKIDGEHFDQILGLMGKMHTNGIAHRDLHTGNMILGKDGLKAIDFGASVSSNPEEIIKELLKPAFMTGDSFDDAEVSTPNSKLRSRYDSARQDFLNQYGKSGDKWPKGKDAETAIADFYQKVLNP